MSCANNPGDEFHLFIKAVKDSCIDVKVEAENFHPLTRTLALWADVNGFVDAATWTKKTLVGLLRDGPGAQFWNSLGWGMDEAATLLACFGRAFSGNDVGHVGRDIVEPCLHHHDEAVVAAAVGVLEGWLDDDPEGVWYELLEEHLDDDLEFPERPDGTLTLEGVRQMKLEFEEDYDEPNWDLELKPYFEAKMGMANTFRAVVQHLELPPFLGRTLGLHPETTLGLLETQKVGHPCVRQSTLEVHVDGGIVRAWNTELAVSIEPTATSGSWLVFARWS